MGINDKKSVYKKLCYTPSSHKKDNVNMKEMSLIPAGSILLTAIQQYDVYSQNAIGSSRFPLLYYVGNCACCKKCES